MSLRRLGWWFACTVVAASGCGGGDGGSDRPSGGHGGSVAGVSGGGSGAGAGAGGAGSGGGQCVGTEPDRNMVTPGELCDRLASIRCAAAAACCTSETVDIAACKSDAMQDCAAIDMVAADPRVGFDAAAASELFEEYEMRACACDAAVSSLVTGSSGAGFTGTVAADGDCTPMGGAAMATPVQVLAALASCNRDAGLACLPSSTTWQCKPRSAAGGPCFTDDNCSTGLYCEGSFDTQNYAGTCAAAKAEGMDCTLPTECASLICSNAGKCAAAGDAQAVFCPG